MDRLTPASLGALIALYEHKTLVEAPYGASTASISGAWSWARPWPTVILPELQGGDPQPHDPSTSAWIQKLKA